ncbi:MAG: hypothetical protein ACR2P1_23345 [Pseudomonadales bacterium]
MPGQAGDLLVRIPADLHEVADQYAFVLFAQRQIVKFDQGFLNPLITGILINDDLEGDRLGAFEKDAELSNGD